jgi:hypothetical protein
MMHRFLVNADGGRKPLNEVNIGLVQPTQELPRVSGEALHISALPFSVKGVKSQRTFARPRNARDDDEFLLRQHQVNVLQVVLPRTPNDDKPFSAHGLYHRDDNFGSQCNGLQRVSRVKTVKLLHSQASVSDDPSQSSFGQVSRMNGHDEQFVIAGTPKPQMTSSLLVFHEPNLFKPSYNLTNG